MLPYLVTSRTRRALLEALWLDRARASASELARTAGIGFASAYRELKAMVSWDLVRVDSDHGLELYAANRDHPMALHIEALLAFRPRRFSAATDTRGDAVLRGQLAAAGVPVNADPAPTHQGSVEELFARGARLARHDPSLARAFPVGLWRARDALDEQRLLRSARDLRARRPLGFLLDVAADVSGERRLHRMATRLLDRRVRALQPFFALPGQLDDAAPSPRAARRWQYRVGMDEAEFASLFAKFAAVDTER